MKMTPKFQTLTLCADKLQSYKQKNHKNNQRVHCLGISAIIAVIVVHWNSQSLDSAHRVLAPLSLCKLNLVVFAWVHGELFNQMKFERAG